MRGQWKPLLTEAPYCPEELPETGGNLPAQNTTEFNQSEDSRGVSS